MLNDKQGQSASLTNKCNKVTTDGNGLDNLGLLTSSVMCWMEDVIFRSSSHHKENPKSMRGQREAIGEMDRQKESD